MKCINRVTLMGNLTADPEIKKTQEGTSVAKMSLATNKIWINKDGEKEEKAEFHRITVWDKLADLCEKFLKKGNPVYLEGQLSNHSYEDKKGDKRYITDIIAKDVYFLKMPPKTEAV